MKNLTMVFMATVTVAIVACNNNNAPSKDDHSMMDQQEHMNMQEDTLADPDVKMVTATFTNVDPGVTSFMKSLMQQYLAVKNALADEKETEAAGGAGKMINVIKGFDKSLFTTDQKMEYDKVEADLKGQAEQIVAGKIDQQRAHFVNMSKAVYELVKAYGAGMTLYHDHCPMYNNGTMWLSETKDIRNPYYGDEMMNCGYVEEVIQ